MEKICSIVTYELVRVSIIAKYLHWRTTSHAAHLALGGFYDGITDTMDEFAECAQGKYNYRVAMPKNIGLMLPDENAFPEWLTQATDKLNECAAKLPIDLQNILLDATNQMNKLSYLLTLD